jgi:hypothetical protein
MWAYYSPNGFADLYPKFMGSYDSAARCKDALNEVAFTYTRAYVARWPDATLVPVFFLSYTRLIMHYSFEEQGNQRGYRQYSCPPATIRPQAEPQVGQSIGTSR